METISQEIFNATEADVDRQGKLGIESETESDVAVEEQISSG